MDGEGSVDNNVKTEDVALTQAFTALFGVFMETLKACILLWTQDHQGHEERSTRTASSLEQWQNITVCQPTHDSLNQRPLSHRPYAHILTFLKQFYLFLFLLFFCKTPCTTQYYFALYIQLFRQRLSHESVKAYATMPIGIMGSNSLALLDWVSRWFSNKEREENEYVFVLFPSTTLKNLEVHSRNCKNHHYP